MNNKQKLIVGLLFLFLIALFIYFITKSNNKDNFDGFEKTYTASCDDATCKEQDSYCLNGQCIKNYGIPLEDQKDIVTANNYWKYSWNNSKDDVGVIQIVNGGTETMWVRYGGTTISDPTPTNNLYWKNFIEQPSQLNGGKNHKWNALDTNGMEGQGDGFQLKPGEYQILPFTGIAAWIAASLGCCDNGNDCILNNKGRESSTTILEWTVPGVWDASAVDGFSVSMRIEIDDPGSGDPTINLAFSKDSCTNPIKDKNGQYLGCKSMCACQDTLDPTCKNADYSKMNSPYYDIHPGDLGKSNVKGGYCGCPCPNPKDSSLPAGCKDNSVNCSEWLRKFFNTDKAGIAYCKSITDMTKDSSGNRTIYCQAYDDLQGTRSLGNGIIKVTIYNKDFEYIKDRTGSTDCGSVPPTPQIPDCKTVNMQDNKCTDDQKYVCKENPTDQSTDWKCQSTPFNNCGAQQCIKDNTPPPPPSDIPSCSQSRFTGDKCPSNTKYICTFGQTDPAKWGCSQTQFPDCNGNQCIKE